MPKKYPPEFKRDVAAVTRRGDLTVPAVAIDFGVTQESVRRWVRQAEVDDGVREGKTSTEQSELVQLRRDKRRLEMENEIWPLLEISPTDVRLWHATTDTTKPTMRAHAYALLRTIFSTAVADDLLPTNPCRVTGAGTTKRARAIRPASLGELEALTAAMPDRLRLLVLLGAWCALRFGELAELRRADIDVRRGVVRVRRGVVWVNSEAIVGPPKSLAGVRDVAIPPHLMPLVRDHLKRFVSTTDSALLFAAGDGRHLTSNSLYWHFYRARATAGRPDLRFHDLRHTGAVLAASTGATLAELMARLGHSSPAAAMKYQHAAAERDRAIAEALSRLAGA